MASIQIESQVTEINNKFKRLIHHLDQSNSSGFVVKNGIVTRLTDNEGNVIGPTERYNFEVNFAYILAEIQNAPDYIVQKHLDSANLLINELILIIKNKGVGETENVN